MTRPPLKGGDDDIGPHAHKRRFDGRVAVVTGAGGGLGRAYSRLLAAQGARVVVNDLPGVGRSAPAASVVEEIISAGGEAVADCHDVTIDADQVIDTALRTWGKVDLIINNAGATDGGQIDEMPEERFEHLVDVNFRGSVAIIRAAWPFLRERRYGRIVNTSSGSVMGLPGCYAYQASKAAIIGLTRALAIDGVAHNIKVNAVNPIAYTKMTADIPDAAFCKFLAEHFPPERAATFVGALVSEEVPCSGELFSVGGGIAARVAIAFNAGYVGSIDATIDDYLANFDTVRDTCDLIMPAHAMEEVAVRARQLGVPLENEGSGAGIPDWSR